MSSSKNSSRSKKSKKDKKEKKKPNVNTTVEKALLDDTNLNEQSVKIEDNDN